MKSLLASLLFFLLLGIANPCQAYEATATEQYLTELSTSAQVKQWRRAIARLDLGFVSQVRLGDCVIQYKNDQHDTLLICCRGRVYSLAVAVLLKRLARIEARLQAHTC